MFQSQFSSGVAIFRIEILHACLMHARNSCDLFLYMGVFGKEITLTLTLTLTLTPEGA